MPPFSIRRAVPADAPAIAAVHTQSWRETYTGLLPTDFSASATDEQALERREQSWQAVLTEQREAVFVAEQEQTVVAFASVGTARDHPGYLHELTTLYALYSVQGRGIGQQLLQAVMAQVRATGGNRLALWVLGANPARQWYATQGAREAGQKVEGELLEIRMVWEGL
ncbi:GNAT family N-acetyltransferase [Deinococcus sp. SL84]|uniref:GNAT family N-acetyltransferase n=1 Tax=Deinococcus sp. SL84 TaxID=2994663 RepID=UPI00227300FC|nr:GNAT family N-acetyltransferase [Deinococcus sp. SL84]MCY1703166.1 GNAT family N-acetyltransferase [Deinococcus sp. SL84]